MYLIFKLFGTQDGTEYRPVTGSLKTTDEVTAWIQTNQQTQGDTHTFVAEYSDKRLTRDGRNFWIRNIEIADWLETNKEQRP